MPLSRFEKKKVVVKKMKVEKDNFRVKAEKGQKKHCLFLKAAQQASHVLQGLMSYNVYQRFRLNLRSLFLSHF